MRTGPTRTQWRCLVAYHRHHGNAKEAAHSLGITPWTLGFHLRALRESLGFDSVTDASLFYADELRRALGRPRVKRTPRRAPTCPGQETLGLAA